MGYPSDAASRPFAGSSGRLSTAAVAAVLGVAPATLRSWRKKGIGPPYVKVGVKTVWYDLDDLEAYLARSRVEPGEPERCTDTAEMFSDVPADDWVYIPPNEAAE